MRVLEDYFRDKGISKDQVGIVCPLGNTVEVKYWCKNEDSVFIDKIDLEWDRGMFCFKLHNGVVEVI